jgi:phosphopantothenoylcysteine synthetase/decarboxylase
VRIIPPVTKKLACGDTGIGAMADLGDIIDVVTRFVKPELD